MNSTALLKTTRSKLCSKLKMMNSTVAKVGINIKRTSLKRKMMIVRMKAKSAKQ